MTSLYPVLEQSISMVCLVPIYDLVQFSSPPPTQKNCIQFSSSKQKISLWKTNESSKVGNINTFRNSGEKRCIIYSQVTTSRLITAHLFFFFSILDLKSSRADCPFLSALLIPCTPNGRPWQNLTLEGIIHPLQKKTTT